MAHQTLVSSRRSPTGRVARAAAAPLPAGVDATRDCARCAWHLPAADASFHHMYEPSEKRQEPSAPTAFPAAFVWSKMQSEAGQGLSHIVRRKELERQLGAGQFWWGIGNALGDSLNRLIVRDPTPAVLFSVMRGRPKRDDVAPAAVALWTAYVDVSGQEVPLPPHVLVTSRATTSGGEKRRHYALVCQSSEPLVLGMLGELDATHYRNFGSAAPSVGASQVTAVVEHWRHHGDRDVVSEPQIVARLDTGAEIVRPSAEKSFAGGQRYEVNLRAVLAAPYAVRLARPVLLTDEERAALNVGPASADVGAWACFVHGLRDRAERAADSQRSSTSAGDLFDSDA